MKMFTAALAGAVLLSAPAGAATLVQYQFFGNTGTETSEAAINVPTGLTGIAFTRGPGVGPNAGQNSINGNSWDPNDYYSFGLNVAAGYTASISDLQFSSQSSGSGPGLINVLASIDGGAFATVASFAQAASSQQRTISFTAALAPVSSIVFRFTPGNDRSADGTGAIGSSGTFRVQNYVVASAASPFSINGTVAQAVAAVPETATWTMMILGFGLTGVGLRRRPARVTFA